MCLTMWHMEPKTDNSPEPPQTIDRLLGLQVYLQSSRSEDPLSRLAWTVINLLALLFSRCKGFYVFFLTLNPHGSFLASVASSPRRAPSALRCRCPARLCRSRRCGKRARTWRRRWWRLVASLSPGALSRKRLEKAT